jgi:hypothetical protein
MRTQKLSGILALIIAISTLGGCGAKPYAEIYMEPFTDRVEAQVNAETGSIAVEQEGVRITLQPLDEVGLYNLTKDADINPYIDVSTWGKVNPLYTVFEIRIENIDNQRVEIDPAAALIDENGRQYNSLSYDDFKDLYADAGSPAATFQNVGYRHYRGYSYHGYSHGYGHHGYRYGYSYGRHGYGYGYGRYGYGYPYSYGYGGYGGYHSYSHSTNMKRALLVARKTVFNGVKLFSGAKQAGLLVFDRIPPGVTNLRVIVPQVLVIDKNGKSSKVDFAPFDFRQVKRSEDPA